MLLIFLMYASEAVFLVLPYFYPAALGQQQILHSRLAYCKQWKVYTVKPVFGLRRQMAMPNASKTNCALINERMFQLIILYECKSMMRAKYNQPSQVHSKVRGQG
jgi:hypothetical protein